MWHCAEYKQLLEKVVPLRKQFRFLTDALARKEMAKEELGHWTHYLDLRKEEIRRIGAVRDQMAEDLDQLETFEKSQYAYNHSIDERYLKQMKDHFDRFKVSDDGADKHTGP